MYGSDKEYLWYTLTDNKIHGANMGPTWVLTAPDGPNVGPMNLAIRAITMPYGDQTGAWSIVACLQCVCIMVIAALYVAVKGSNLTDINLIGSTAFV